MPLIEIKHRYTGEVLHSGEYADLREAVVSAVKQKVDLSWSNLRGSNLSWSNLIGSNLRGSDLRGSDLSWSNLRGSNLRGSDLSGSDLSWSNLRGSNLRGSDLSGSNLIGSNLRGSDLSWSNLSWSNLIGSNLRGSDLSWSNLSWSNLIGSNLRGSDLSWSNLSWSNLSWSNLRGSDLSWSNLRGSDLSGSNLSDAQNADLAQAQTSIVADGELRVWKKCRNGVLVHLLIPSDAKRSNATGRKCRAEFADVLDVIGAEVGISQKDGKTTYRKGERVTCDKWEENRFIECGGGIHFFLTRIEAENF